MNAVLEALKFRHACKKFDPKREIPVEDLLTVLECGRISPSSFGMEPWKFLVVQDTTLREKLRVACWNQPQITEASEVVVILARPQDVRPVTEFVKAKFARRRLGVEAVNAYMDLYRQHFEGEVEPVMSYYAWASKQCYIALANMLTAAAASGIDSCPIEGFSKKEVEDVLDIDGEQFEVAVIFTLGYRAGEQTPQLRSDASEIIEYR
jgi:nitroreductase